MERIEGFGTLPNKAEGTPIPYPEVGYGTWVKTVPMSHRLKYLWRALLFCLHLVDEIEEDTGF